ncbi:hypothetical protein [Litoreibacter roseus]|uniref:APCDD1 domain-containing protein n=1 Tax=Litoreibacter roseus TaxID=2601869 RepID=A0A6N6JM81_9RHOB|nr:hypothetical protein [Litoreibacter roseus]GFE67087.1 hypothetical protein KIN_41610 [Litoreibacter roseus]
MSLRLPMNLLFACIALPAHADTTVTAIQGTWVTTILESPTPGGGPPAYVRQTTSFDKEQQTLTVEAFSDPSGTQPLFRYDSFGPFTDIGPWEAVPRARALDLENDSSVVTIFVDAPDLWRAISLANCDLTVGVGIDITDCVNGPPFAVTDCIDMDIVLVDLEGTRLRYGGGENVNRCITRPTEVSETAFFKVE